MAVEQALLTDHGGTGDRILILDFGSQYTQLIARRVREAKVYSEILPYDIEPERISEFEPRGIILSGGPESAIEGSEVRAPHMSLASISRPR